MKKINKAKSKPFGRASITISKSTSSSNTTKSISTKERYSKLLFFTIKFLVIFAVLNVLIWFADLSQLNLFLAKESGQLVGAQVKETSLTFGAGNFVVTNSCTGLVSISILASIIFAFQRPKLKKRLALFIIGAGVLFLINIPRIALVVYSSSLGLDAEAVHELTWFLMSAIILIVWFFGMRTIAKEKDFVQLI